MIRAKLSSVEVGEGRPVAIVYALNVSPSSFYRGSIAKDVRVAVEKSKRALEDGASIIDVGGVNTGPGSKPIPADEELNRLIPVIKALSRELDVPISVDTQRAAVAEAAIEAGAEIVNDISGLKSDERMAEVISGFGCSAILMATDGAPGDPCTIGEIKEALGDSLRICSEYGIPAERVVVDPAIGHWPGRIARLGKRAKEPYLDRGYDVATSVSLEILGKLRELESLGRPICVGISRKSFIGEVLNLPKPEDRLVGSLAATVVAVLNGASVVRTHDPKETLQAVRMAEAINEFRG